MKRALTAIAIAAFAASTVAAAPQSDARSDVDHELALEIGESDSVTGGPTAGVNPWNFQIEDTYRCDHSPEAQCEVVLLTVTNPYEEENARKGRERATINLLLEFATPTDMALNVWETDESGERGEYVGYGDNDITMGYGAHHDTMAIPVTTAEGDEVRMYRVEVIYWAHAGDYTLHADFA